METTFDIVDFWARVKQLCKEKKITQKGLSTQIGYEQRTIEAQMFKKIIPDVEEVLRISTVLNVSLNYLIHGTETISQKNEKAEKTIEEIASIIQSYKASQ